MEIFATTGTVLVRFGQIVHDPFPDQILGQRLPPGSLLNGCFGRFLISFGPGGWLFAGLFRLPGLPEFFKQPQLLFGELFALAVALCFQQFAQQTPVLVLFRAFVLELLAQVHHDLLQRIDIFRQCVGIDGRHLFVG